MVDLICFDFWGTLYNNAPKNQKKECTYNLIYNAFYKKISINEIIECLDNFDRKFNNNKQYSNLDRIYYIENIFKMYLPETDKLVLEENISNAIIKYPPILDIDAKSFLKFLKENNYNIVLVSDTNYSYGKSIKKILEKDNIIDYFDYLVFSDETKLRKPNPKIFQFICEKFNISPYQSLFIGDSEKKDIIGPKNQGFYTAKKCTYDNIMLQSECDIKFISFSELQKEFIKGGFFYGI